MLKWLIKVMVYKKVLKHGYGLFIVTVVEFR